MKRRAGFSALVGLALWFALAPTVHAQRRPYIGYVYPAGGEVCTTFQIKFGGQDLDEPSAALVTGAGVTARIVRYDRRLNNQEQQLLNEQLRELKRAPAAAAPAATPEGTAATKLQIARIEKRVGAFVQTPAAASLAHLVIVEVTIAPDAAPGAREIRLVTTRGVSNPLMFHVGQVFEYVRKPMLTATIQILGKEAAALRKRPAGEAEDRITTPCTVNGQIASGEVNRYRFAAAKGERLVISTQARQLIPFIADAVPGWFQPVIALYDAAGKEMAYADDYRFKPDPVILFEVPQDGEYVLGINDALYRGREDFVYRITIGGFPFLTSLFPLGGQVAGAMPPTMAGWNLGDAQLVSTPENVRPGIESLAANNMGFESNRVPFALDRLPDQLEAEPNNSVATAQKIALPLIVNGHINQPGDWDVFQFTGKANQAIVAEVSARRLDSPLDSVLKLTDAAGKLIAFSDDREDLTSGPNTHQADSYLTAKLPADGIYFVHIGDTARQGGEEYGYRLRLSAPQPDFELRVVPSSVSLALNQTATVTVYAARKDGFAGPIKLALQDPTGGITAIPVTMAGNQIMARLNLKAGRSPTAGPVKLFVTGSTALGGQEIIHEAVPAEDRMQAFLWRHLVPASDLSALVFDPSYQPPPKRIARVRPPVAVTPSAVAATIAEVGKVASSATTATTAPATVAPKPKFTKQQIVGRLRELKRLYEEGFLTDDFYDVKVAECEAVP